MHKTATGDKLTDLYEMYRAKKFYAKKAYEEYIDEKRKAEYAGGADKVLPKAQKEYADLKAEADAALDEICKLSLQARLEDLNVWVMEKVKTTKKGNATYGYWMASWREKDDYNKVHNVHLGSCKKMDKETALQKARKIKAEALGLSPQ